MTPDFYRVGLFAAGIIVAFTCAYIRVHIPGNEGYLANLIVTVFSVLAGFLSVVLNMVLLSRPPAFKSKTAQAAYAQGIRGRLLRHSGIFYCYLLILACVFLAEMVRPQWIGCARLLEAFYCGLAGAALLWSFSVPKTLARLHEEQLVLAEEAKKN